MAGAAGPHPDADMLTAFAEGALGKRERESVLGHLAACANCRAVLGAAAEAAEAEREALRTPVTMPRRPTWGVLAGLATAAVLLAVSGIVVRQQLRRVAEPPAVAQNTAPAAPPQSSPAEARPAPLAKRETRTMRKQAHAAPEKPRATAEAAPPPAQSGANGTMGAGNTQRAEVAAQLEAAGTLASARMAEPKVIVPSPVAAAPAAPVGGPEAVRAKTSSAAATTTAFVKADATPVVANVPQAELARPRWRIDAEGKPERAIGAGKWEPVALLQTGRMLAIATIGSQVWTGGENTELFRSADNGETWAPVTLPQKGGGAHTIVHIRLGAAGEITVAAKDGTAWTSTDGGATWK